MSFRRLRLFLFIATVLTACEHTLPAFDNINLEGWKSDKNGCEGRRTSMIESLKQQKNKLQGLSEMQIISLLGRPDQNELYKRNQKFFNYYLNPGKGCGVDTVSLKLSIRFNATGRAKEIAIE